MKRISQDTFNEILNKHQDWISGAGGEKADFSDCDLRGFPLNNTNLSYANLSGADLSGLVLENVVWHNIDLKKGQCIWT